MNDIGSLISEYFVYFLESVTFSLLGIYQGLARLSLNLLYYLSSPNAGVGFRAPLFLSATFAGYIAVIVYSYRKNFNDFTRAYSSTTRNISSFSVEMILLALYFLVTFPPAFRMIDSAPPHYLIPRLVLVPFSCFLLWVIIESFFFSRRWDINLAHRPSSWMVLYFIFKKYDIDTEKIVDDIATLQKADAAKATAENGYKAVSDGLEAKDAHNVKWVRLSGRGLRGAAYALRYHELYGKAPYISLFLRIIITPFIAIALSALFAAFVTVILKDTGKTISSIYLYFQEISDAMDGFFFFIFGPAFYPATLKTTVADGFYHQTQPIIDQLGYFYVIQQVGMFLLVGSILLFSARGAAMGILAQGFVWLYAIFFAGMAYFSYTEPGSFSYFSNFSRELERSLEPDGVVSWIMKFSGMASALDELPKIDNTSFALMMLPGVIFWLLSAIIISWSMNLTRAGALTYSKKLWLPFISKGNLDDNKNQLSLPLRGGYSPQRKTR
jgi:hypothetical protein